MVREITDTLRIFRRESPVTVLGPGQRAVLWVQGCPFACPGCIVPESWAAAGGTAVPIAELATWILAQPDLDGLTLSGGEPMQQAAALVALVDEVRSHRDLSVMSYTGYTLEALQQRGTAAQQALLARLDVLVDGRYQADQHGDLLWRGSHNQRLILLTDRDRAAITARLNMGDQSAGLTFVSGANGALYFTGVPAIAGFRPAFEAQMRDRGIALRA